MKCKHGQEKDDKAARLRDLHDDNLLIFISLFQNSALLNFQASTFQMNYFKDDKYNSLYRAMVVWQDGRFYDIPWPLCTCWVNWILPRNPFIFCHACTSSFAYCYINRTVWNSMDIMTHGYFLFTIICNLRLRLVFKFKKSCTIYSLDRTLRIGQAVW